jgi:hypothetical protein
MKDQHAPATAASESWLFPLQTCQMGHITTPCPPSTARHKSILKPTPSVVRNAAAVRRQFRELLRRDAEKTLDRLRDKRGKVVLNSDDLFKILPRYEGNPPERKLLGPLLYPVAAEFTDDIYERLLSRPVEVDDTIVFTAGGSATGKSTILRTAGQRPGVDFIVDTTFSDARRALSKVKRALASGRNVEIYYVYRKFSASVRGMLHRALDPESGRIVPIDDMARTHFGAQRAILEALTEYQDDPRVSIALKENASRGKLRALSEEAFFRRLHPSVDKLQMIGQRVLDEFFKTERAKRRAFGRDQDSRRKDLHISRDFYEAARSQTQARGTASGQGDA